MIFNRIDVKEKLEQVKSKSVSNNINYYKSIFDSLDRERTKTLGSLENPNTEYSNKFIFDKLDTSLIFHASHIKNICSDYRYASIFWEHAKWSFFFLDLRNHCLFFTNFKHKKDRFQIR